MQYDRAQDLLADDEAQFQRGGVLVRVEPPPGLALFETVELEIATSFAGSVVVAGQVVQLVPGAGVAVTFDPTGLANLVAAARAPSAPAFAPLSGPATIPCEPVLPMDEGRAERAPPTAMPPASAPRGKPASDVAARIHAALYGNKDERWRVLRDVNKLVHPYVLKNTGLGLDEVLAIAKLTTVASELLGMIAERREWAQRPDIAIALVRNPKTPTAAALRLLDYVAPADLRHLAKDSHTRPAVQQAARKKVLG